MTDWQPIETAPKGDDILVYERDGVNEMVVARFDIIDGWVASAGNERHPTYCCPTHWTPLPKGPKNV